MRKRSSGFPTRSDTNLAVQPQKISRGLKFQIKEEEELYHPCSENKGADQLRGYREADLRLCFRICKKPVISQQGHLTLNLEKTQKTSFILTNHKYVLDEYKLF